MYILKVMTKTKQHQIKKLINNASSKYDAIQTDIADANTPDEMEKCIKRIYKLENRYISKLKILRDDNTMYRNEYNDLVIRHQELIKNMTEYFRQKQKQLDSNSVNTTPLTEAINELDNSIDLFKYNRTKDMKVGQNRDMFGTVEKDLNKLMSKFMKY